MRGVKTLCLILIGLLFWQPLAQAWLFTVGVAIANISVVSLPLEARETLTLIKQGGPFPYSRDGKVFGNREHRLPSQPCAFYHEYTVKTPGVHNRGARRIVCGIVAECYYTDNHYQTFKRIKE